MGRNLEAELGRFEITRQNYLNNLDRQRIETLSKRDAKGYFRLCNELGINSEDIEDFSLYERGQLESIGRESNISKRKYSGRKRVPKSVYQELITQSGRVKIRPWNAFDDIVKKRDLLKKVMGYTQLKTNQGYVPIDRCEDSRIGQSFAKTYKTACKAVGLKY